MFKSFYALYASHRMRQTQAEEIIPPDIYIAKFLGKLLSKLSSLTNIAGRVGNLPEVVCERISAKAIKMFQEN